MLDESLVTKELLAWLQEFVEVPNPALGNWAPCPFARRARINNQIAIKITTGKDFLFDAVNSLDILEEKEVLVLCFDHKEISPESMTVIVQGMNEALMKKNIVILEGHPDLPENVSGIRMNFEYCGILVLQKLDKLNEAADQLREKGYFDHWDQAAIDNIVTWRYNHAK
jgi:hypothetical protein